MSHSFIDRGQQKNISSNQSETTQKKIDPAAQLKRVNSQQVDQGWGVAFNYNTSSNQTTQKFASDEMQQLPDTTTQSLPAGAQAKEGMNINSNTALEKEADVMGAQAQCH